MTAKIKMIAKIKVRKKIKYFLMLLCLVWVGTYDFSYGSGVQFIPDVVPNTSVWMTILNPSVNITVSKSETLMIKGVNRLLTPTWINGERVVIRTDGRFYRTIALKKWITPIVITMLDLKGELISVGREVRMDSQTGPKDLGNMPESNRLLIERIAKSGCVPLGMITDDMSRDLTRSELAYALLQLKFPTLNVDMMNALPVAISKGVLGGKIADQRPTDRVTIGDIVVPLSLIYSGEKGPVIPSGGEQFVAPSIGVSHWMYRYWLDAVNKGWIFKTSDPRQVVSREGFYQILNRVLPARLPEFVERGAYISDTDWSSWSIAMRNDANKYISGLQSSQQFQLLPMRLVNISPTFTVSGRTASGEVLWINGDRATIDRSGRFKSTIILVPGRNSIEVQLGKNIERYAVIYAPPYDMRLPAWSRYALAVGRLIEISPNSPTVDIAQPVTELMTQAHCMQLFGAIPTLNVGSANVTREVAVIKVAQCLYPTRNIQRFNDAIFWARKDRWIMSMVKWKNSITYSEWIALLTKTPRVLERIRAVCL